MDNSIRFIEKHLNDKSKMHHQASSIGYQLFLMKIIDGHSLADNLILKYKKRLVDWNLEDLLSKQVEYGIVIAESNENLEYEEMHKLFSLCDEI
ncbi:hypothetical protein [Aquimarina celericrescens]|uniref:Uncharacterized protein n=1 Tax=Aquimarina celericrescens TaxID=1964542 RepID=A0ABW5AT32_9FLAO|nr:hypothetical protein [Aquimarina celericrescens]